MLSSARHAARSGATCRRLRDAAAAAAHAEGGLLSLESARLAAVPALPLALVFAYHVAVFLSVSLGRMSYPFELEFMEGLSVDYAQVLLRGEDLYGPASASFAPLFYPPLHYVVALPALLLGGWSLAAARLVSWFCIVACLLAVCISLRRLGGSAACVLVSVAVALALYPASLYWYDLARVDSLQTSLQVGGLLWLATRGLSPRRGPLLLGAVFLAAAVFTKQTALAGCLSGVAWFGLQRDWRRALQLLVALSGLGLIGCAALLAAYGPDCFQVLAMPTRHAVSLAQGWRNAAPLLAPMAPLVALALIGARDRRARPLRFFLLHFGVALVMGLLAMCKHGGQANSLLPAFVLLGACTGLGWDAVVARLPAGSRLAPAALATVLGALLFLPFRSDYADWIPSAADRADAEAILQDMRAVPGPFLAYNHSFVSTVLRGESYPSWHALWDWAGGEDAGADGPDPGRYPPGFLDAVRARRFAAIYTNGSDYFGDPVYRLVKEHYHVVRIWPPRRRGGMQRWMFCLPRVKWQPVATP